MEAMAPRRTVHVSIWIDREEDELYYAAGSKTRTCRRAHFCIFDDVAFFGDVYT